MDADYPAKWVIIASRSTLILTELDSKDDWVVRVQRHLLTSDIMLSLEDTANGLGMSVNSLRWHLRKCGTSYRQIVLGVRMRLACQYLRHTRLTLQQIGHLLGYNHNSSFQLSFRKYFDIAPGQWPRSNRTALESVDFLKASDEIWNPRKITSKTPNWWE